MIKRSINTCFSCADIRSPFGSIGAAAFMRSVCRSRKLDSNRAYVGHGLVHAHHLMSCAHAPPRPPHFLPFFFFFPPPAPPCCPPGAFALPSGAGVCVPLGGASAITSSFTFRSSAISGNAAICLPNLPRLAINLPTSHPLFVLYLSTTPASGLYVRISSVAAGGCGAELSSPGAVFRCLRLDTLSGWGMLYLVVILVCLID